MPGFLRWMKIAGGCLLLLNVACERNRNGLPPGVASWVDPQDTRLVFNMPELASAQLRVRRYRANTGELVEEIGEWHSLDGRNLIAGLFLSESAEGPPLTDPWDPNEIVAKWAAFKDQSPSYGPLHESTNVLGPVLWRRASIGTRACVVFLQRWSVLGRKQLSAPITALSGYYCNTPGDVFSPAMAERVVKSVGLGLQPLPPLSGPPQPPRQLPTR